MARPRTSTMSRMSANTASSALGALDVVAETSWLTSPMSNPPASAPGSDTKAPNAAEPRVNINRFGPSAATLKLGCVGACSTAVTAANPPAKAHVTALTRRTEMPDRRAASGLLAAARICFPSTEYRMNAANPATRMGTMTAASTYMPVRVTPPMRRSEWNGWG